MKLVTFANLSQLQLVGDNLVQFKNDWDKILLQISSPVESSILETLLSNQLRLSQKFTEFYTIYRHDILLKERKEDYLENLAVNK